HFGEMLIMNLKKLTRYSVMLFAVISISANAFSSGAELYTMCKTIFIPKAEITQPSQIVGLGKCMGYVRGFAEASSLYETILTKAQTKNYSAGDLYPFVCGLAKVPSDELAKEIVRFIDNNPSIIEEHPTLITMSALGKKYSCEK
ncbi:Rap1a/Tai family immunity protein, partial [Vibrio cholerae]